MLEKIHHQAQDQLRVLLQRAPPLILLQGPKGVAKHATAQKICEESAQQAKGDTLFYSFAPQEESGYKLEEIKEIMAFARTESLLGQRKILLVDEFVDLAPVLLNTMLKIFEEPPSGVTFILVVHQEQALLDTIASRAIKIPFGLLCEETLRAFLEQESVRAQSKEQGKLFLKKKAEGSTSKTSALTLEGKSQEELERALGSSCGQLHWARRFLSESFLKERASLINEILSLIKERRNALQAASMMEEKLRSAKLLALLERLDEPLKEREDRKKVAEEILRLYYHDLSREMRASREEIDGEKEYWTYQRFLLRSARAREALERSENLPSALQSTLLSAF